MPIKRLNIPIRLNDLFKVIRFFNSREEELHVSYRDLKDQLQTDLNVTAGSSTLDGLSDVVITSVANGQVLVYDSATSQWINQTAGPATTLNGLSDVIISSVANGQFLVYNSTSAQWENTAVTIPTTLNSLSDVTISSPSDGDVLTWDSSGGEWVALAPVYSSTFAGLSDVDVTGVADENTIKYDAASSKWVPTNVTPATSLNGLTDVTLGTLSNGQFLVYDSSGGGQWINQSVSPSGVTSVNGETGVVSLSLNDLDDVTASPVTGDYLKWNSGTSQWVNAPIAVDNGLSIGAAGDIRLGGALAQSTILTMGAFGAANNRLQIDAPQNTWATGSLLVSALNPGGTYTSSNNRLAYFTANDIVTATFQTGNGWTGNGIGVEIISTHSSCTPIVIKGNTPTGSGEVFKITDDGQITIEEYRTSTSFQSGSGTSVGVLNVDAFGKVFVGGGGSGGNSIASLSAASGDVSASAGSPSATNVVATLKNNLKTGSFGVTVDGVTGVVQVGVTGYVVMPYAGTITGWSITSNVVGTISFDITSASGAIPTLSIITSGYPTITGTNFITSTAVGGWSTTFAAGDVFGFSVRSSPAPSLIKNATLTIRTTKT